MSEGKMTIQQQQEVSYEFLQALTLIDEQVVISGGAPRNWTQGILANDIDCYLRSTQSHKNIIKLLGSLLGETIERLDTVNTERYNFNISDRLILIGLINLKYKGVLFQVIILHDLTGGYSINLGKEVVNHMDIGINQISWDPTPSNLYRCNKSHNYLQDVEQKTLTLFPSKQSNTQLRHCMAVHLPKMVSYYPDHQIKLEGNV